MQTNRLRHPQAQVDRLFFLSHFISLALHRCHLPQRVALLDTTAVLVVASATAWWLLVGVMFRHCRAQQTRKKVTLSPTVLDDSRTRPEPAFFFAFFFALVLVLLIPRLFQLLCPDSCLVTIPLVVSFDLLHVRSLSFLAFIKFGRHRRLALALASCLICFH